MFFLYSIFLRLSCYLDLILVSILDKDHTHSLLSIFSGRIKKPIVSFISGQRR